MSVRAVRARQMGKESKRVNQTPQQREAKQKTKQQTTK